MTEHSELVSVVIPTYNRGEILEGAINTVQSQTYKPIEIIVVDDGSTDRTPEIAEQYGDQIRYIRFDENRGANAARNAGIEAATGEYVAFLDTDDRWKSNKITRQITRFQETNLNCGLVHTGIERRDLTGNVIDRRIPPEVINLERQLLFGNFVGTYSCILLKASVFDVVGTPNEELPSWQDWEFYLRIADEFEFALIPEPLTIKRAGRRDQISRNIKPLLEETYPILNSIIVERAEKYGFLTRNRALAGLRNEVADAALMNQDVRIARHFLIHSLLVYPFNLKTLFLFFISLSGARAYRTAMRTKSILEKAQRIFF